MRQLDNINEVISKVEEMRGFFKIGDEIIPFVGDLFIFLKDIMPLMAEVNTSMKDSTSKLPTASAKISTATKTAELATHEIMDKLESITIKLTTLSGKLNGDDKTLVNQIDEDIMDAIYALQFQDITSQQLEHANRILSAIYDKFSTLFDSLESVKVSTAIGDKVIKAIEESVDERKKEKDHEDFEEATKDTMRHTSVSQDDIDQMFS